MDTPPPLGIGIVGLGNVGCGVARILTEHADLIEHRSGRAIEIRRAAVRDLVKPRAVRLPAGVLTDDVQQVLGDPSIEVVIQLVGGDHPAREFMLQALEAGQDVVTANKALLCEHGGELFARARELRRTIAFEAAVAGGIPIIATVGQSMSGNQIVSIEAILNGTSNYILTEMLSQQSSYEAALRRAQQLGYAEADPAMDVDGTDAAQKLVILTQLAYGTKATLGDFALHGIDQLELVDLEFADELGYRVKLLAVSRLVQGQLEMHVQPTLVKRDRPLAQIEGPFNAIALEGDAVGKTWHSGPGAGQMPTASAVVADIVDLAVGRAPLTFKHLDLWRGDNFAIQPAEQIRSRYYLRFNVPDRPHVLADIADVLGRNQISIASVIQHEAPEIENGADPVHVPLVIMTHRTTEGNMRAADAEIDAIPSLHGPRIRMPVAD